MLTLALVSALIRGALICDAPLIERDMVGQRYAAACVCRNEPSKACQFEDVIPADYTIESVEFITPGKGMYAQWVIYYKRLDKK